MAPVRRTLPTLLAGLAMLALIGLAIASNRQSPSGETAGTALNVAPASLATAEDVAITDSVPTPDKAVLAEMTRRLGTPRQVKAEAKHHLAQYRRSLRRLHARQRAAAAARAARAAAAQIATSTGGNWVDPEANSVAQSQPTSAAENAWLQGGYGGWVEGNGMARAPVNAPAAIKNVIAAGNRIARSPYLWGGGHGRWQDSGYDCSGSVSYALAYGGMLGTTLTSGQLMGWGEPGPGKWLTIYANEGHVFMYVAGLRFDTSGRAGDHSSRWQLASRSAGGFVARHYPGL